MYVTKNGYVKFPCKYGWGVAKVGRQKWAACMLEEIYRDFLWKWKDEDGGWYVWSCSEDR